MRKTLFITALAITAGFTLTGCSGSSKKMQEAHQAEKSGQTAKAVKIYTAVSRGSAAALKFPDSKKGGRLEPAAWRNEVEKYLNGISGHGVKPNNSTGAALDGLDRCMGLKENDNSVQIHAPKLLDEKAFGGLFNNVFTPPSADSTEWSALVTNAFQKNFSILQISSPVSYSYEVSVVSRSVSRRIDFTMYPESKLIIPLASGDYSVIVKSSVTFQQGQYWTSEFSAFQVNIPAQPSLVAMNLRTKVARKQ
ncbi:MAG: hypothetical protein LBB56_04130 [Chitinispirillales bacterium]|jgi:hypothetical protein|nr:hypothetical protein [Chitinispirillales bacterium]